jgi:hypothetical protein
MVLHAVQHHRTKAVAVAVGAALLLTLGAAADGSPTHRPAIHYADGVPDDVRRLAGATWARFLDVFPARMGCVPDVTLATAWSYRARGRYQPARRLVTLRIPGTAPNLSATMVHEFAHHLDYACPDRELRRALLAAQGLPPGTPWRHGRTWAAIPAEQFAQAVIQAVLGPQPGPLLLVRAAAVRAITAWGRGG